MALRFKFIGLVAMVLLLSSWPQKGAQQGTQAPAAEAPAPQAPAAAPGAHPPDYVLGPNDQIVVMSLHSDEISNKPVRVSTAGDISLPLVGRINVAGLTLDAVEREISERLKMFYKQPDVSVNVVEFKSQPVSVFGAVGKPGLVQLEGRKTLIEVLSEAGGLRPEAGSHIKITRRKQWGPIPLENAKAEGEYSSAEVNILSMENATRPEDNIQIFPNDVITVPRADIVYVIGEVKKPGGFTLNNRRNISLIEAIARAEGTLPNAATKKSKIIRPVPGASREEIEVDLKAVLDGKNKDITLGPDDILFIPSSYAKGAFRRTLDTAIQMTTGVVIYRY